MKIETKFNIGDTIFYLVPNIGKVVSQKIQGLKIEILPSDVKKGKIVSGCMVTYLCNEKQGEIVNFKVEESKAYKSKEELLKSL